MPLRRFQSAIPDLRLFQQYCAEAIDRLEGAPWFRAIQIDNVALGVAPVAVFHGLGRVPRRWTIVRKSALADVADSPLGDPTETLGLVASAAVTVSLLVE